VSDGAHRLELINTDRVQTIVTESPKTRSETRDGVMMRDAFGQIKAVIGGSDGEGRLPTSRMQAARSLHEGLLSAVLIPP
jgi:hypothetical protein